MLSVYKLNTTTEDSCTIKNTWKLLKKGDYKRDFEINVPLDFKI